MDSVTRLNEQVFGDQSHTSNAAANNEKVAQTDKDDTNPARPNPAHLGTFVGLVSRTGGRKCAWCDDSP